MTVGIVGLGLIGGSIGLSLRDPHRRIIGCDPSPQSEATAKERSCVDEIVPLAQVAQAEIVFVAAPPRYVVSVISELQSLKGEDTVVTDCASVKAEVVKWAEDHPDKNYVPGHPMAGHEKSGAAFASAWMFRGARWILSPTTSSSAAAVRQVESVVKAMGAIPVRLAAEAHDHHMAVLSHLPHVLAGTLVQMADGLDRTDVLGGSWRDLTRVGGVDPELWTQIISANRGEISQVLGDFISRLQSVKHSLESEDMLAIRAFFESAQSAKARQADAPMPQNNVQRPTSTKRRSSSNRR